ncbi:type II toxin-antitoxin system Phd/YefM family antitoxin [Pseudomonas sp. KSR10]|uniref:type II toxin-antitoxin system Phd/YefM family antitoxin n=1 Tax=Pseudomonas sp. KSR10 TaxID=2916654 RepID=UPI001EF82C0C|nr:type II toxin-antitoxin system Phd/YefM family antitoxin [Pseudomonas sp. KSR10]MCG6540322.1 type II toxin-antitoxin system Phd/YefM family antitoxin [Pseudomonas sp. KSR10]
MAFEVLADVAASTNNLKRNPMRFIREGAGEAVVIPHRNRPAFYAVPPALYEALLVAVDDAHLAEIARARRDERAVRLDIDELIALGK